MSDNTYFEKQRDLLIQEIGLSMESVIFHLDTLNRSLGGLVAVGKEFDEVARLWSHFYDGPNQLKERKLQEAAMKSKHDGGLEPGQDDAEAEEKADDDDDNDQFEDADVTIANIES